VGPKSGSETKRRWKPRSAVMVARWLPQAIERSFVTVQACENIGESGWDRTIDTLIKSQVLYH
jgi:hypothetical protein